MLGVLGHTLGGLKGASMAMVGWVCVLVCALRSPRTSMWRAAYAWLRASCFCFWSSSMASRSLMRWSFRSLYALCDALFCALLLYWGSESKADARSGRRLTESTEGGAFLYLFSRFLFGAGLRAAVDLTADVAALPLSSCFTVGWGDAVAGDEMGLGYIPDGTTSKSKRRDMSNYTRRIRTALSEIFLV